jgi:MscS family membrane protein
VISPTTGYAWRRLAIAACLAFVTAQTLAQEDTANWGGEWDTRWAAGSVRLVLEQKGDRVTGSYPLLNGQIEARAEGRELRGHWMHDGARGELLFVQSRRGDTFAGRFGTGEWWTGIRAHAPRQAPVSQVSPRATLQSFLRLIPDIDHQSMDALGTAASLTIGRSEPARLSELDYARLLSEVINAMTFQLWSVPATSDSDEVTVTLAQAGTEVHFDLTFRHADEAWFIVPPPPEVLERTLASIPAARRGSADVQGSKELRSARDAFRVFLDGMRDFDGQDDNAAYATLNTSAMREVGRAQQTELYARYLHEVLDRVGFVYLQEVPDDPARREPYVHFHHPAGNIAVAPYKVGDRTLWQFTPDTLRTIRDVYEAIDDLPVSPELARGRHYDRYFLIRNTIRTHAPALLKTLGPMEGWQWLTLGLVGFIGFILGSFASRWAPVIAPHRARGIAEGNSADRIALWVVRRSVTSVVMGIALLIAAPYLALPEAVTSIVTTVGWVLVTAGLVPIAWEALTRGMDRYTAAHPVAGRYDTLLSLSVGLARIVLLLVCIFLLADALSIPYQGLLAGLGIGGLAVALAIQPLLQNFLSGFMLYADRPIAVGDYCKFGDKLGTVEHVGMRSTRIRSPDRTVITIPNSEFANMQLENFSRRDRIWLKTILQLRYETSPEQLRFILTELRRMLIAHPKILADPLRVRFIGFGAHSLDVEIFAYVMTPDYNEFTAVREDVLLRMMELIEEAGGQFAFPSTVEYQAKDKAPDADLRRRAEAKVEEWRKEGKLPFPDFDWRDKSEMRGTLRYPPEGSASPEDGSPKPA